MSVIDTLITDRAAGSTYGASDLNRVGSAVAYLADRFREAGYAVNVSPKTDWTEQDWPTPSTVARYLADLSELRGLFAQMQSTPAVPSDLEGFLFQEANDIEKILRDISTLLDNIIAAWFHSGEIYAGEA